jgi:hypothetical protein
MSVFLSIGETTLNISNINYICINTEEEYTISVGMIGQFDFNTYFSFVEQEAIDFLEELEALGYMSLSATFKDFIAKTQRYLETLEVNCYPDY